MDNIKILMERVTAAAHGCSVKEYEMIKGAAEEFESSGTFEQAQWGRAVSKIASEILKAGGYENSQAFIIYDKLSKAPEWCDGYNQFVEIAEESLGKAVIKSAAFSPAVAAVASKAALTPEALRWLIGLSAAGGAGLGSLAWLMRRDSRENDEEIEALEEKRKYYNQLAADIKSRLDDKAESILNE
jgi:hypothetical protein